MRFTIEARELTSEYTHRPVYGQYRTTTLEAKDAEEAISRWVEQSDAELVSFTRPRVAESVATVKKEDTILMVRVYAG